MEYQPFLEKAGWQNAAKDDWGLLGVTRLDWNWRPKGDRVSGKRLRGMYTGAPLYWRAGARADCSGLMTKGAF